MKKLFSQFAIAAALTGTHCTSALAAPITMHMTWSGASFGNSAVAHGSMTFDDSLLGFGAFLTDDPLLTALTMTVSGVSVGNGTYGKDVFGLVIFDDTAELDFSRELVGQVMSNQCAWGVASAGCDAGTYGHFNLLAAVPGTPQGTFYFEMTNPGGEVMKLTSMRQSQAGSVPEPSTLALFGLALAGAAVARRKRALKEAGPAVG